ncbi:hypothetical protein CK501_11575 [Halovibrio salipaludis]|uniref:Lipoprotein n=1 Tax=Halovibrio salipaludis TaxID=2032626 RepID=A0A2A2F534_9GAMM|nr:hypothetical protein [Halovibrio salipaludis]PAU79834.1 hypothetical protein CK501_11575 [Halovibrio salipaludis]
MLRRLLLTTLVMFSVSCAASLQLSPYPDVFVSEGSLKATLVKEKSGDHALLRITGTEHEIDGVVFRTDITSRGEDRTAYEAKIDGETRALLLKSRHWGSDRYTAYLPDGDKYHLSRDKDESESLDTDELLSTFQQQKNDGVQDDLAAFDRDANERAQKSRLTDMDASASDACGSEVSTNVDWNTIDDSKLKKLSVAGYCGIVVSQMERLCSSDESFKSTASDIDTINCGFRDALKLKKDGSSLNFTTGESEPNQQDFVRQILRNL